MAASKKAVAQAKSMAASGASANKIENKTGVSSNRAAALVAKNTPMPGQPQITAQAPAQTKGPLAPGVQSIPGSNAINANNAYSGGTPQKVKYNNPVQEAVATYADWNTGGNKFGGGDIKALQEQGLRSNQIMKIAAGVGNLTGVSNSANTKLLAGLPSRRKGTNALTAAVLGSQTDNPLYAGLAREQGYSPKKQLSWGGITGEGKPMALSGMDYSKDLYGKGKAYTWTPGKGLGEKALDKLVTGDTTTTDTGGDGGNDGGDGGAGNNGGTVATTEEEVATTPEATTPEQNMPGMGADLTSFATGWKSRLSSRKGKGLTAQGLASQRLGPMGKWQYNI
jgi:hypothetical protein